MKFVIPVAEFSLVPDELHKAHSVFKNGFPKVGSFSDLSFYQVLVEGNAILLKKDLKKIIENREYNSAVTTKEVVNSNKYFLFYNGKMIEIKKDKTFFIAQLGKSKELGKFIADNNVNFKNETHLIRFIDYFNTLTK